MTAIDRRSLLPARHRAVGRGRHLSLSPPDIADSDRPCHCAPNYPVRRPAGIGRAAQFHPGTVACPLRRPVDLIADRAGGSHAYGEQKRRAEGEDGGGEGGDQGPYDHCVQERAGLAEAGVRAGGRNIAPHPADDAQVPEQHQAKAKAERTGRPGEGAANGVERVEDNECAAPDAKARPEPPQAIGWNGTRAHGRAASIATREGSARTRPREMAPTTTV